MSNDHYPDTTTFPRIRAEKGTASAVIERQRISEDVRGLPNWHICGLPGCRRLVDLDAVLEIIDGQP